MQINTGENSCEKQPSWHLFAIGKAFFRITGAPILANIRTTLGLLKHT